MLRALLCSVAILALLVSGPATGGDKKNRDTTVGKGAQTGKKGEKATITKVDRKKGTISVKMKNKQGKEVQKTFRLTEDVRMLDSTGRAAVIEVFQSGDDVLIVEAEGKLKQLQKHKKGGTPGKTKAGGQTSGGK